MERVYKRQLAAQVAQNQLKAAAADMHTTALGAAGSGGVHKQHVLASAEAAAAAVAAAVTAEDSLARVLACNFAQCVVQWQVAAALAGLQWLSWLMVGLDTS